MLKHHEQLHTLNQIIKRRIIPPSRSGKRVHVSTLIRWIRQGLKTSHGQRVRLEAVRVGGKWATSLEALDRFFHALTPKELSPSPAFSNSTSASERAAQELDRLGI